jgi:hypothetical protein
MIAPRRRSMKVPRGKSAGAALAVPWRRWHAAHARGTSPSVPERFAFGR